MRVDFYAAEYVFATVLLTGALLVPDAQSFSPQLSKTLAHTQNVKLAKNTVRFSTLSEWSEEAGLNALRSVQSLASKVAESTGAQESNLRMPQSVAGTGGKVFSQESKEVRDKSSIMRPALEVTPRSKRQEQVWSALANLELDMQLLDNMAGQQPQLTALELSLLSLAVAAAASGPFVLGGVLTEFVAPTSAAFSAAIGIGAEYVGRVSVADGKEVAAAAIGCAAEAEGLLANAERAKAITPLCVGVSATATTLSLLVPVLLENIDANILSEIYFACPLTSDVGRQSAVREVGAGRKNMAKYCRAGKEQVQHVSKEVWRDCGADFATKSIIVTALAAAQCAWVLARCENVLARATDACAVKARSAAVCDTYANQGARSAAILPFTSALSGLCAAATAAIVELPFLEALSASGTFVDLLGEMAVVSVFPAASALFAAAASVSKARCEVQAEAAVQAASTLALEYNSGDDRDPLLRPFRGVIELIQLTYRSSIKDPIQNLVRRMKKTTVAQKIAALFKRNGSKKSTPNRDSSGFKPAVV
eukprot:scaffold25830_cov162-Cylindrotheca_fusiformis.AAC.16